MDSCSYNNTKANTTFGGKEFVVKTARKMNDRMLSPKIETITISAHASPDDDTNCAKEVFGNYLTRHNKKVNICVNESKTKDLFIPKSAHPINSDKIMSDLAIMLDFNSKAKLPKSFAEFLKTFKRKNVIGFDHHPRIKDKIKGSFYIDTTSKSCCGILYRYFEALGEKLPNKDLATLYCGVLSDYRKSKLIRIENGKLTRLPDLSKDKNSRYILDKLEFALSKEEKEKVYKHLDILSNLTPTEKEFQKEIYSKIKVSKDKKLAYVIINKDDQKWNAIGGDTARTSEILGHLRRQLINPNSTKRLTEEQKEMLKDANSAIIFYQSGGACQMSIHTKPDEANALRIIKEAKKEWDKYKKATDTTIDMAGGGHKHRAGSRILSTDKQDIAAFISCYMKAAEKVNAQKENKFLSAFKNLFSPKAPNKGQ